MQVSTRKIQPHTTPTTQSGIEKQFNDAWQRVVGQQKKNDALREQARAFAQDIQDRIQDKERAYMDSMYFTCLHLLSFCTRKSLARWHREILLDWVIEYMDAMANNPFGQHLDMSAIRRRMADAYAFAYPEEQSGHGESATGSGFDENGFGRNDEFEDRDIFEDLFAEFEQADAAGASSASHDDMHGEYAFDHEFFRQQQAREQQRHEESQALRQLIRSSSVNKLFRKLAGILHPDKERDETLRPEKNRLMGELIQARDTNDMPKLFGFYADYVGGSPLQELGDNLEDAVQLLDRHFLDLRDQEDDILDEDPLTGALYRRFYKTTASARQRAINKHLKEIQALTSTLQDLRNDISSVNRLKPYLEFRREMFFREDGFDFI